MNIPQLDSRYVAHTYRRFPLEIVGGEGCLLQGADGREYIDLGSGIGVNIFGINDKEWKNAVVEQLNSFQHCSNLYYSAPAARLAEELCKRTQMEKVFFSNSGAEANECAIKVARKWAADNKGKEYVNIVTLKQSFHGRTLATLSATGQDVYHEDYHPLPDGFLSVDKDARKLEELLQNQPCAAILFECVQGEGGVMPLTQDFADSLAELSGKYHVLLMADEVQLGNGRSGALYGYMRYGLRPDVVTTAKGLGGGLPLGAALMGARVCDVLQPGSHGSTFGGNPVSCAGALSILRRIDDAFLQGVKERSDYIVRELSAAEGISDVSGLGLMLGFRVNCPSREFAERLLTRGVLVTTAKDKIRLLPPLNIPIKELKAAVEIIKDCAKK